MALSIQDSRILLKRSTNTSEVPTAAPSSDFTDGTWTSLDVYVGEAFANTVDEKLWLRFTNNIRQIAVADSPTTNRLTYWNASGHLGNVSAPTDGYVLKYTNASGYHWVAPSTGGSETLAQTLALGNTSGAYDILMNTTQRIGFKDGDNTNTSYISNNQTTGGSRTAYLPLFDGQLAYHATGVPLVSGRITFATTNGALTDSANFLWDNSNYRLGVGNGVSSSATIHGKGSTADSTAFAFKAESSSSGALLYVRNDGAGAWNSSTLISSTFKIKNRLIVSTKEVTNNDSFNLAVETDTGNGVVFFKNTSATGNDVLGTILGTGGLVLTGKNTAGNTRYILNGADSANRILLYSDDSATTLTVRSSGAFVHESDTASNKFIVAKNTNDTALTVKSAIQVLNYDTTANRLSFIGFHTTESGSRFGGVGVRFVDSTNADLLLTSNSSGVEVIRMELTSAGNQVMGSQVALATNATDGFLYVPSCAGTPTGTPTAYTGKTACVVDSTNGKFYIYTGGAWVALN